jgi:hypothetical protein
MTDPITIITLVTVIITGISQIAQLYFDYKRDEHSNSSHIYKEYKSNCCSTVKEDDN